MAKKVKTRKRAITSNKKIKKKRDLFAVHVKKNSQK